MTLKECYETMGADYQDVLKRLMSEKLIQKFSLRFLEDKSFDELMAALDAGNGDDAFRGAHTLKGVSQNLGFTRLYQSSGALTESLRGRVLPADEGLVQAVKDAYRDTVDALEAYKLSQG